MSKLKTEINGKFPFVLNDIRFLDSAYRNAIIAIAKSITKSGTVIFEGIGIGIGIGIEIEPDISTPLYVDRGYVYRTSHIYFCESKNFPSGTVADNLYVHFSTEYDSEGLKQFGDGTMHDTYYVYKAEIIDISVTPIQYGDKQLIALKRIEDLWEVAFEKKTAFNKDFGMAALEVSEGNHNHSGVYEPVIAPKNSAFNKNFGTAHDRVSQGDHDHSGIYEPAFIKKSAFNKDFGANAGQVAEGSHNHNSLYSSISHNHAGIYEPVFTKKSAFNKDFGANAGQVAEGNHNHSGFDGTVNPNDPNIRFDIVKGIITNVWTFIHTFMSFSSQEEDISPGYPVDIDVDYTKGTSGAINWSVSQDNNYVKISPNTGADGITTLTFTASEQQNQGETEFTFSEGGNNLGSILIHRTQ